MDKKNNEFGINLKSEVKNKVRKLILDDGTVIDLKDTCHLVLLKEKDTGDSFSDFSISYRITKNTDYCFLSNNAFLMASCFRIMDKEGLEFEEAFIIHKKLVEDAMERSGEIDNKNTVQ